MGANQSGRRERITLVVTREEKKAAERVANIRGVSLSSLLRDRAVPGILEEDRRIQDIISKEAA